MKMMIQILVAALMAFTALSIHTERKPHLILAGPLAAVSFPLIHMVESGGRPTSQQTCTTALLTLS